MLKIPAEVNRIVWKESSIPEEVHRYTYVDCDRNYRLTSMQQRRECASCHTEASWHYPAGLGRSDLCEPCLVQVLLPMLFSASCVFYA